MISIRFPLHQLSKALDSTLDACLPKTALTSVSIPLRSGGCLCFGRFSFLEIGVLSLEALHPAGAIH